MTRYIKKPKPIEPDDIIVIYDDREKKPWHLPFNIEKQRLKCGDYTIKGYEDIITIEKKSGLSELLADLTVNYKPTFERFLKRLSKYPVKCIVVEGSFSTEAVFSAIAILKKKSKGKSHLTVNTIYYWLSEISTGYGIPIIFTGKPLNYLILKYIFESAYRKARKLK